MYVADEGLPSDIVRVEHQLGGSATVKIKSNQSICTVGSLEGHILYVDVQYNLPTNAAFEKSDPNRNRWRFGY
jgi:hypothetical protein